MPSFEVLSWSSLTKLSPFAVERGSFDLALKRSEDSDSFRATLSQIEKPFKYLSKVFLQFTRASYIQVQRTIIKISLSINCTVTDECVHPTHFIGDRNKLLKSQKGLFLQQACKTPFYIIFIISF